MIKKISKNMCVFIWAISLHLIAANAFAQFDVLKLKFKPTTKQVSTGSNLSSMKAAELSKNWKKCVSLVESNMKQNPSIKGWVLLSGLKCAARDFQETKNQSDLQKMFEIAERNLELLHIGTWAAQLENEYVKNKLSFAESILKTQPKSAWKHLDSLIAMKNQISKASLSKVYLMMAELAQAQAKLRWAAELAQYSVNEADSPAAREKLQQLQFALNKEKPTTETKTTELFNETEIKFDERIRTSSKANEGFALSEDCVAYLKALPGGKKSKWCVDRLLETHTSLFGKSDDAKFAPTMERFINIVDGLDADRLSELARNFHRRGDFDGSLKLASKAYSKMENSKDAAVLLYVMGRSSQFLGQYSNAQKYFQTYLEKFSGADDVVEVLFRLGLVFIRQSDATSAIATFEKLLNIKGIEKYELSARYWLVRSLQWTSNPRAEAELTALHDKFMFSYYGLKLKLEKQNGVSDWPSALKLDADLDGEYHLSHQQKKSWDRVQLLANNGWSVEAHQEFLDLPHPVDADLKVLVAGELSKNQIFPPIIKLIQGATDINTRYRSFDVVNLALPKPFNQIIEANAKQFKLSPILVRSLMRQESAFNIQAVSTSPAFGLMQLIAPTAEEVIKDLGLKQTTVPDDLFIPDINIKLGSSYIAKMLNRFSGQVPFALAAYNAGPTRMKIFIEARPEIKRLLGQASADPYDELWMDEVPWYETSFYVKAILRNTILYKLADKANAKTPDERKVTFAPVLWSDLVVN
jgi:soluble lytic murein transglycosylase